MGELLVAPVAIICLLVAGSGAVKLVRPLPAGVALQRLGVPSPRQAARVVGVLEIAFAGICLAWPGPVGPALLAVLCAGFAFFLVALRRRDPEAGCGCFGSDDPPSAWTVGLDVIASAVAAAAAVTANGEAVGGRLLGTPVWGLPALLACVTAAWMLPAVVNHVPRQLVYWIDGETQPEHAVT